VFFRQFAASAAVAIISGRDITFVFYVFNTKRVSSTAAASSSSSSSVSSFTLSLNLCDFVKRSPPPSCAATCM